MPKSIPKPVPPVPHPEPHCPVCGDPVEPGTTYCSMGCRIKSSREQQEPWEEKT